MRRWIGTLGLLVAMAACTEDVRLKPWQGAAPETEAEHQLCEFGRDYPKWTMVRHHNPTGLLAFGDIEDFQGFADLNWTVIQSALAQPVDPVFETQMRADCKNPNTGTYYPCYPKFTIDMSDVGAMVRSNLSDPAEIARQICERAARAKWLDETNLRETNASQECRVTVRAVCPLPIAPDTPAS